MSVFEARISALLFIGLSIVITINALFFQPAIGLGFRSSLNITPPLLTNSKLVRDIQGELILKGYQPGNTEGKLTLQTSAAILAFEYDHQLPMTGRESARILKLLLFGKVMDAEPMRTSKHTLFVKRLSAAVQRSLNELGFHRSDRHNRKITNLAGQITAFEKEWNMPETGRISGRFIKQLAFLTGDKI